ncbi:DNA topoisomerase IB [Leucobacter triazinivorans]|uniref:DNA topoisomerase n=1 Tax=Leucobacter triazinivorans TaxID=1784719 RepID=A0A4P6KCZ3_9MICO|nr:DNA topoisomerase IB [Leucobacter triazinivorans]QBE48226.1 DNA topoisomerase IB [Leucobacter triazinivorans]
MPSRRRRLPITREVEHGAFVYRLGGRRIRARREIERLDALAIPPAWTDVEIARSPSAKVLARGHDAAGRTQTIYHPAFRRRMERRKFDRIARFGEALPRLRARVDRDLRRRRLSRDRVTACVIRLIDRELFRVGNAEYAQRHRSYGVTTLRTRHVRVSNGSVEFDFTGKSGRRHRRSVRDPRVARLLARLGELPGHEVFHFLDDDEAVHTLRASHVNAYVKRHAGAEFSAKDFRTWGGTLIVVRALLAADAEELSDPRGSAAAARAAVQEAAELLGNTAAVTRSSYIDPRALAAFEDPELVRRLQRARARLRARRSLSADERCALLLLSGSKRRG